MEAVDSVVGGAEVAGEGVTTAEAAVVATATEEAAVVPTVIEGAAVVAVVAKDTDGYDLDGRALRVNESRPRADRSGGGGGFYMHYKIGRASCSACRNSYWRR